MELENKVEINWTRKMHVMILSFIFNLWLSLFWTRFFRFSIQKFFFFLFFSLTIFLLMYLYFNFSIRMCVEEVILLWKIVACEQHVSSISNTFIRNARLKLAKCQANNKQHSKTEFWLFENYSPSSSTLPSKN